jgi:hypothetical protein
MPARVSENKDSDAIWTEAIKQVIRENAKRRASNIVLQKTVARGMRLYAANRRLQLCEKTVA